MSVQNTSCCGLDEFHDMYYHKTVKDFIIDCLDQVESSGDDITPHILFTDVKENSRNKVNGEKLHKFILENKLGTVVKTPPRINTNSNNKLICYLWTINRRNLIAWHKKNK